MGAQKGFSTKSKYPLGKKKIISIQASGSFIILVSVKLLYLIDSVNLQVCAYAAGHLLKILPFLLFLPQIFDFILNFSYRHQYRAWIIRCLENS